LLPDRWQVSRRPEAATTADSSADPDPDRSRRAAEAMLKMNKINIAEMERAADGR
jgi:hypothetical protein